MKKVESEDIEQIYSEINKDFNSPSTKIKVNLIYAFNGTGRTRISRIFTDKQEDKVLCFNSIFQDEFSWVNDSQFLNINNTSWIVNFITEQGLEKAIEDNFKLFCDDIIEPSMDLGSGIIEFSAKTKDGYDYDIKISKAEESLFIWSIFYTFIDSMIYELKEEKENRSTDIFDNIKYIVIDDPVSSIDDIRIMNIAVKIYELIERINELTEEDRPSILITTHHALFYNAIYNLLKRENYIKFNSYVLIKNKYKYCLEEKGDSPFGYHLILVKKINEAINNASLEKINFNMFRILLEKTANYFGYKKYEDCLPQKEYTKELIKLINLYSHGNLPEFEYSELADNEKNIFTEGFKDFINYYKMNLKDE